MKKVEHIGIAVKDLSAAVTLYQTLFPGLRIVEEPVADGAMKMVICHFENLKLELMEPLQPDSPVGKFIAKHGEGLHHIAYQVEDINEAMATAMRQGFRFTTEQAYVGAEGNLVCFMHPKDTFGVLSEFCQYPAAEKKL